MQDLCFTDKFIPGKENPTDYSSQHPNSIDHPTQEQREEAGVDDGTETHVMRILLSDLPEALSVDLIKEAVAMDPIYQKLVVAIRQRKRDQDPDLWPYRTVGGSWGSRTGWCAGGKR